jgi:hypothetical protein
VREMFGRDALSGITDTTQHAARLLLERDADVTAGLGMSDRIVEDVDPYLAERGWWSVTPPRCTCGLITYAERPLYSTATNTIKLIAPRTSDEIAPNLDGATTFTLSTRSQARA